MKKIEVSPAGLVKGKLAILIDPAVATRNDATKVQQAAEILNCNLYRDSETGMLIFKPRATARKIIPFMGRRRSQEKAYQDFLDNVLGVGPMSKRHEHETPDGAA